MPKKQLNEQFRESFIFVVITQDIKSACYVSMHLVGSSEQNAHSPP